MWHSMIDTNNMRYPDWKIQTDSKTVSGFCGWGRNGE